MYNEPLLAWQLSQRLQGRIHANRLVTLLSGVLKNNMIYYIRQYEDNHRLGYQSYKVRWGALIVNQNIIMPIL